MFYITSCKSGSETVDLKFQLGKGGKYEYATNMDMTMNQMGMQAKTKMGVTYLFEVVGDSAGWKQLSSTIQRVTMDVDGMGMNMSFDSDKPSADTAGPMGVTAKMFTAMKGGKFSFTMNEKGEVGSVSGIQEMVAKMLSGNPNAEQMLASMQQTFSEENFKQNVQQSFAIYPDKPVKVGESWKKSMVMQNQGMTIKSDNTYTLESVKGDDAAIKVASNLSSDSTAVQGVAIKVSGTSNGNMNFHVPTGLATSGKVNMNMDMKMNAQGQEMPMKMDMIITITGKKQ